MRKPIDILDGNPITDTGSFRITQVRKLEADYEELEKKLEICKICPTCKNHPKGPGSYEWRINPCLNCIRRNRHPDYKKDEPVDNWKPNSIRER